MGTAIEPDMGDLRRAWMVSEGVRNAYRQHERRSLAIAQSVRCRARHGIDHEHVVRLPRRFLPKAELLRTAGDMWLANRSGGRLRRPLEEADDRLNHCLAGEQFLVVMIGLDFDKRLGSDDGVVEAPCVFDGHDGVESTRDDQDRRSDLGRAIDGREAVLKKHPHRQQRVVMPADLG